MLISLLLFSLLFSGLLGCKAKLEEPGSTTPAELLKRQMAAIERGDREDLARCFAVYVKFSPEAGQTMADLMLMPKLVRPVVIDGVKTFGAEPFSKAVGGLPGAMLASFCNMPNEQLLEQGKITVNGDKATFTYKVKGKDDPLVHPQQPQLAAFDKINNWGTLTETSMDLEQVNGRWFLATDKLEKTEQVKKAHDGLTEYVAQLRKGIAQSADAEALTAFMVGPNDKLLNMK
jgi:hypothetical protein